MLRFSNFLAFVLSFFSLVIRVIDLFQKSKQNDTGKYWSELPEEILGIIARRLPEVEDLVRFSRVCRSWRSITVQRHYFSASLDRRLPWLIMSNEKSSNDNTRRFFSLSQKKAYKIYLSEAHGRECWGSKYGWLITVSPNLDIKLLNPLSRLQICLPPSPPIWTRACCEFDHMDKIYISIATLFATSPSSSSSSSTTEDHFIVTIITNKKLQFARPGDKAWKCVKVESEIADITYLDGHFYFVDYNGTVLICKVDDPNPKARFFAASPSVNEREYTSVTLNFWRRHLVESLGEIYMVVLSSRMVTDDEDVYDQPEHNTKFLKIYKLDFGNRKWEKVKSLGERAFFVGANSLSISTSDYPEYKSNCFYYTGIRLHSIEAFNLEDNSIKRFHINYNAFYRGSQWMTPNLF